MISNDQMAEFKRLLRSEASQARTDRRASEAARRATLMLRKLERRHRIDTTGNEEGQ